MYQLDILFQNKMPNTLFSKKIIIWFIASVAVLIGGGIADKVSGTGGSGGVDALGMGTTILIEGILFYFLFRKTDFLGKLVSRLSKKLWIKSVFIGWFSAMIVEAISYPTNPLFPGISFWGDLILTSPPYIFAHYFWFLILRKYKISIRKSLAIGGTSLLIAEYISGGMINPIIIPITAALFPALALMHGFHMVMPRLILNQEFSAIERKESRKVYLWGLVYPLIGLGIGIIIMFGLAPLFNIS